MSAQPIDLETRAAESDHAALRLWLRLLSCTHLSAEDLISRDPDPLDRRVSRVKLTATGRRRFAEMAAAHESWVEDLTRQLSRQDIEQLFDLLGKLKSSVHQASHTPTTEP